MTRLDRARAIRRLLRPASLLLLLAAIAASGPAPAGESDALLEETARDARDDYLRALAAESPAAREHVLRRAAAAYRVLHGQGLDGWALWTNLGHCHLRLEEPGLASLAYLRALERNPRSESARLGLLRAREAARLGPAADPLPGFLESVLVFHLRTSLPEAGWILAGCWAGALLFAAVALRVRGRIPVLLAGAALAAALLMAVSVGVRVYGAERTGVVVTREASLRSGPAGSFPVIARLREAARVRVLESRAGWVHVEIDDGQRAWAPAGELEEV
jgi:hypothetical protein